MKRWYLQLFPYLIVGLLLITVTVNLISGLKDVEHSGLLGWLGLNGLGIGTSVGALLVLVFILCADALWLLFFILWLIRKGLHMQGDDNAL